VIVEVKETLSVHKQSAPKFVLEQFNMKKLIEVNVREDHQLKIFKVCSFGELKR
jgi:hypothetical protein